MIPHEHTSYIRLLTTITTFKSSYIPLWKSTMMSSNILRFRMLSRLQPSRCASFYAEPYIDHMNRCRLIANKPLRSLICPMTTSPIFTIRKFMWNMYGTKNSKLANMLFNNPRTNLCYMTTNTTMLIGDSKYTHSKHK